MLECDGERVKEDALVYENIRILLAPARFQTFILKRLTQRVGPAPTPINTTFSDKRKPKEKRRKHTT